jgi:phage repressor protein C with HTH and peptisase S24 domain
MDEYYPLGNVVSSEMLPIRAFTQEVTGGSLLGMDKIIPTTKESYAALREAFVALLKREKAEGRGQAVIAEAIGVLPNYVSNVANGRKNLGEEVVMRLDEKYPGWRVVHNLQDNKEVEIEDEGSEYVPIKRVNLKISAGISGFAVEELNGERPPVFFRRDWVERKGLRKESLFAIVVHGESMEPSLYDGDLVVINSDDKRQVEGEVYAFNYDGEAVIKRLHREAGLWYLNSDNPDKRRFPNKVCHENCLLLGRIIYKQSERI